MQRRLDSYRIIGSLVIGGVLAGLVGLALQRLDVVLMIGAAVVVVLGFVGARDRGIGGGDGGGSGGVYEPGGGCGDAGDGGGD